MQLPIVDRLTIKSKSVLLILFASISSILVISAISLQVAQSALQKRAFDQLTSIRTSKAKQVESYFENARSGLLSLANGRTTATAVVELGRGYRALDQGAIQIAWESTIATYYTKEIFPKLTKNSGNQPDSANYQLTNRAAQYLQYYYLAKSLVPLERKDQVINPGDGSDYSKAHEKYHDFFRTVADRFGCQDLYLINARTGDIIYSVRKGINFGTNLDNVSSRNSNFSELVERVRNDPQIRTVQIADFQFFRPAYEMPAAFMAVPVYNGPHFIGVLVAQLSPDSIGSILTDNKTWNESGLGQSGETYLVGSDFLLRSNPRLAIENPQQYQSALRSTGTPDAAIRQIERLGSAVLSQKVETPVAQQGISGVIGTNTVENYQKQPVLSAFAPLRIEGLKWAILSEMNTAEALAPFTRLQVWLLIASTILIVLFTFLGIATSRFVIRPVRTMMQGIKQLKAGDYSSAIAIQSDDEFGELAQAFNEMVQILGDKLTVIEQKNQENEALLLNIVPLQIAQRMKQGELHIADHVKQVTILYARVVGIADLSQRLSAIEVTQLLTRLFQEFDDTAERFGLERKNTIDTDYMAVCGLSVPRLDHTKRTVDFALEMLNILHRMEFGQDINLGLIIGIHTGSVTAGIIGVKKFGYNIWGEAVYLAMRLYAQAELNSIVLTRAAYERVADTYTLVQYRPVQIEKIGEVETWLLVAATKMAMSKVDLVQSSFAKVQPIADTAATLFYGRLFELSPSLRPLFKGDMEAQKQKLMATLAIAVEGLRNPAGIVTAVQNLGKRHAGYGVKEEHYSIVGEALLWTLEQGLGDAFTPQVRRAWEDAYAFLSEIMKDAVAQATHQDIGV